jgi:glycosyltransferase involved in cell wall biosynthesis
MRSELETRGGAAVAASRLAGGLCHARHEVLRVVCGADGGAHPWATHRLAEGSGGPLPLRIARYVAPAVAAAASQRRIEVGIRQVIERWQPDVVNVHNLHGGGGAGWSLRMAATAASLAPTLWTLHDMWSFTGRCAYSGGCGRFVSGCDASCPTPAEYPALTPGRIADAWAERKRLFASLRGLAGAAPSRWLAAEAGKGLWSGHRLEVIPNGLCLDTYRPRDRRLAREAVGIPQEGLTLLIAAEDLSSPRKGGALLAEALRQVTPVPATLLALGGGSLPPVPAGIQVRRLGFVSDDRLKSLVNSAADLYVHPATEDNLPNTLLESIACGTPVVGLPAGGVPEVVRHGVTGWLAERRDASALAVALSAALSELLSGTDLRSTCRSVAEAEYGLPLCVERYEQVLRDLVAGRPNR